MFWSCGKLDVCISHNAEMILCSEDSLLRHRNGKNVGVVFLLYYLLGHELGSRNDEKVFSQTVRRGTTQVALTVLQDYC